MRRPFSSTKPIAAARDAGVNFIDTSDAYAQGDPRRSSDGP
jgi:aryl-alcohol dehydrogenase-like predicted oxidoreductase